MADTTYKIIRFTEPFDPSPKVIKRGLTLEEAQAHCRRDDTHGGDDEHQDRWFDGYDEETK